MLLLFHSQIYIPMPSPILDQRVMYISGIPEAPDLEVVKDYLNAKLKDAVVESCKVLRPCCALLGNGSFQRSARSHILRHPTAGKIPHAAVLQWLQPRHQPHAHWSPTTL